jgi:parallel beta-helix repeat protein
MNLRLSGECSDPAYVCVGESIQEAAAALGPEGVITIAAGTHLQQSITPKDGQSFVGEPGAILDGELIARRAFGGTADNVTLSNLVVTRYAPVLRDGTIQADQTTGWTILDVEVSYSRGEYTHSNCTSGCGGMGIRMGRQMTIRGCQLHHNDQYGIAGDGDGSLIENTEIAFNNDRNNIGGATSSGTKFTNTDGLVLRGNYVHDNGKNGLWLDINNIDYVIEDNVVENNGSNGIFIEVSLGGVIRNNQVRRNGLLEVNGCSLMYCSGILVAHSPDVEVYGNTVEANYRGIGGLQQDRNKSNSAWILNNLWVHDNVISGNMDVQAGIVMGGRLWDPTAPPAKNRFDFNTYTIPTGQSKPFKWRKNKVKILDWLRNGMDLDGVFM